MSAGQTGIAPISAPQEARFRPVKQKIYLSLAGLRCCDDSQESQALGVGDLRSAPAAAGVCGKIPFYATLVPLATSGGHVYLFFEFRSLKVSIAVSPRKTAHRRA